jgi:V/A-type H+-transporting ATPase subunit E
MHENTNASSSVQNLIERIRDQGVQAAETEADRLLRKARQEAAEIVAAAKAEAEAERSKAKSEIEAHRTASLDALQLAARDTVLDLKARVVKRFEQFVKRLVVSATHDEQLVRNIVLVLAGRAAEEFIQDKQIEVRISQALLGEATLKEEGKQAVLALSSDMLREGIELIPSHEVEGGVRVQLVQDQLEIDLSDRAVARLISERMVPRFKTILEGAEAE